MNGGDVSRRGDVAVLTCAGHKPWLSQESVLLSEALLPSLHNGLKACLSPYLAAAHPALAAAAGLYHQDWLSEHCSLSAAGARAVAL